MICCQECADDFVIETSDDDYSESEDCEEYGIGDDKTYNRYGDGYFYEPGEDETTVYEAAPNGTIVAEANETNFCDTCDKEFYSNQQYQTHMSQHRVCGLDGCTFTAHEKIVEKHVMMQHSSGLYDKIRNISTPEDVAKWIEQRKKRYPSKENVELRYKRQEEMVKRGELLGHNKKRFDRNRTSCKFYHLLP